MGKIKMLCTGDYEPEWFPKFEEVFDIERKRLSLGDGSSMITLKGEELVEYLAGEETCVIGYGIITGDIIKRSADVRLLLSMRDGPEGSIDIGAYTAAGILIISSAGRHIVSTAEFAFPLMLMLAKSMVPTIEGIRSEGWTKQNSPSLRSMYVHQSTELYSKDLGIVGFGRNVKSLSILVGAFHMQVNTYGPCVNEEVTDSFHVEKMDLDQVVKIADYIIVLARLTPGMEGILGRELIFSTKLTASIVNTGWARLVDGEAILDTLERQVIKFVALDVHTPEPLGILSENRTYRIPEDRLIIMSHAADVIRGRLWHQCHLLYKRPLEYSQGNIPEGYVSKQIFDTLQFKERGGKCPGIR